MNIHTYKRTHTHTPFTLLYALKSVNCAKNREGALTANGWARGGASCEKGDVTGEGDEEDERVVGTLQIRFGNTIIIIIMIIIIITIVITNQE
jgi:hypothetical protein